MSTSVWKTVRVPDNDWISHRIGPLSLYLKRVLNEIWVADSRDDNSYGEPSALPEEPEWTRTALPEEYDEFDISPVLPDRPVVVDSDQAYRITPNTGVRTYCRIPAFARITPKHLPELIIAEIPTVIL